MLQLLYYITFRSFCQVNILWTEVQPVFFPFLLAVTSFSILSHSVDFVKKTFYELKFIPYSLFPRQPVQNSQPIHSTTLQAFCQVNFSWTIATAPCRSPDPFHCFRYSQVSSTFALVRQLYYYITLLLLCQVENRKEYKPDFIHFAHMYSVYSKTGSDDTPPKPVFPLFTFYRFNSFVSVPAIKDHSLFE